MKKTSIIAAALLLFTVAAKAQMDTTTVNFLTQASIGNIQEINSGKLAAQKASNARVKAFGNRMAADHGKAQAQVMQLIRQKGYNISSNATNPNPPADPMLAKVPPGKFDKLYVHMMVPDHSNTVQLFQRYIIEGKDPDVRAFAQQTLPVLKSHLAEIKAIDGQLK